VRGPTSGSVFALQVKGFQSRPKKPESAGPSIPLGQLERDQSSDFFALVYIPEAPEAFEFFLATRQELQEIKNSGGPATGSRSGSDYVYYRDIVRFQNSWDRLPRP
jgi:hypothetical protein